MNKNAQNNNFISELRLLSDSQLLDRLKELKSQFLKLRFQRALGVEIKNTNIFSNIRKNIAQIMTIMSERK